VCRKIVADFIGADGEKPLIGRHDGQVLLYGDPAGGQRSTKYEHGNDWTIITDMLGDAFGRDRVELRVPRSAPRQRARVNAVNSRLKTADGVKHLVVSPAAKNVVRDLDLMRVKAGTAGELDEGSDDKRKSLGHLTAGLGYYLYETQVSVAAEQEGEAVFVM